MSAVPLFVWLRLLTSSAVIVLSVGLCWGFQGLLPSLVGHGIYNYRCPSNWTGRGTMKDLSLDAMFSPSSLSLSGVTPLSNRDDACPEQMLALNKLFMITSGVVNSLAMVNGIIADYMCPRILGAICSTVILVGLIIFGFGTSLIDPGGSNNWFDPYLLGFLLFGVGGNQLFMVLMRSTQHAQMRQLSWLSLPLLCLSWDISTVVFVLFTVLIDAGVPFSSLFLGYGLAACIPTMIFCITQLKRPDLSSTTYIHEGDSETSPLLNNSMKTPLSFRELYKEIITAPFLVLLGLFMLLGLFNNYYLATVTSQGLWVAGTYDGAHLIARVFSILLPVVPLLGCPITSVVMKRGSPASWFGIVGILCQSVVTVSMTIKNFGFVFVGHAFFIYWRIFWYSCIFGCVEILCNERGQHKYFSTLTGILLTFSGLASFAGAPLDSLVINKLNGNYLYVNIALNITVLITIFFVAIFYRVHNVKNGSKVVTTPCEEPIIHNDSHVVQE